jgi:hypothetical protein
MLFMTLKEKIVYYYYEFYKTLDCDTSWLGHDERSEECFNRTSVTVRPIKRVEYTIFSTLIRFLG